MRRAALLVLAASAALLIVIACSTNPATGRRQLILLSQSDEIRLGQQADPGILAEYGRYENAALSSLVDRVGTRLAAGSERPSLPYTFTLLDSPVVNAFALPGGPVYATRGLLAYANDEAELAGVLGHEVGHVIARHGAEQASRGQLMQIGIGILSIAKPKLGEYGDLLGTGAGLLLLSFGRDAEREADRLGVRYLGRAGYDPFGLPRYLGVLDALAKNREQVLPSWLSTHPDPGQRVTSTNALAQPVLDQMKAAGRSPRRAADEFLPLLDGMVYGDDPREGFRKGLVFHHPDLRFRFEIAEGWTTLNTRQFVAAVDSAQNTTARLVLRAVPPAEAGELSPADYAAKIAAAHPEISLRGSAQRINGLSAWYGEAIARASDGSTTTAHVAWIRHGELTYQFMGQWSPGATQGAIAALERSIRSFREETDAGTLGVKPVVLRLVDAPSAGTLADLCRQRQSDLAAPCEEIGQLNRVAVEGRLERGARLKLPLRQHSSYP